MQNKTGTRNIPPLTANICTYMYRPTNGSSSQVKCLRNTSKGISTSSWTAPVDMSPADGDEGTTLTVTGAFGYPATAWIAM